MNEEWVIDKINERGTGGGGVPIDPESSVPSFFIGVAGATPSWGNITGDISNQTDLQTSLDSKVSKAQGSASLTFGKDENGLFVDVEETA